MSRNIYIITLFDDKQFISNNLNKLVEQINQYCQDNKIVNIKNEIYVFDKYKLKNRIFNGGLIKYPFKTIQSYKYEDYFKDELDKRFPNYKNKSYSTKYKYMRQLLNENNFV